jgi:hypothetical protein
MKSLTFLWRSVADDLATWCGTSTSRDFITVSARVESEGLSFLTITLPNFGKDFERGLDQGYVDHGLFTGFQFTRGLPRFLGGFLDLVFDRGSGLLLDVPSIDAIFAIRQLTLMFGKLELPCSESRVAKAMQGYIECEQELGALASKGFNNEDLEDFRCMANALWLEPLCEVDRMVYDHELIPKHGPGATADKLRGNAKFKQNQWTYRMEQILPVGEYLLPSWRHYRLLEHVEFLEPGAEQPTRVISVPKTLKTPRIIAIEPTCMQYMQQALSIPITDAISKDDILGRMVGFDNQIPNQEMARRGSREGDLATLDLSEASDRVSNLLVEIMFSRLPHLAAAVQATRSLRADVPGYGVIPLSKFASMGSGLCFPVEAMVFSTILSIAICRDLNLPLRRTSLRKFCSKVRVYGDDIVVPVEHVQSVVELLEAFGFKVNSSKSFWTGKFRESCGKEYFNGQDVSIVKVRQVLPNHQTDVKEIVSLVSLRNQLYERGIWGPLNKLDQLVERFIPFPNTLPTSPLLGRRTFLGYDQGRLGKHLHEPQVKGARTRAVIPHNGIDDLPALLKVFLKRSQDPLEERHLERSGRPKSVCIKIGWGSSI